MVEVVAMRFYYGQMWFTMFQLLIQHYFKIVN